MSTVREQLLFNAYRSEQIRANYFQLSSTYQEDKSQGGVNGKSFEDLIGEDRSEYITKCDYPVDREIAVTALEIVKDYNIKGINCLTDLSVLFLLDEAQLEKALIYELEDEENVNPCATPLESLTAVNYPTFEIYTPTKTVVIPEWCRTESFDPAIAP